MAKLTNNSFWQNKSTPHYLMARGNEGRRL
jgi:hypothetical protein